MILYFSRLNVYFSNESESKISFQNSRAVLNCDYNYVLFFLLHSLSFFLHLCVLRPIYM